MIDFGVVAQMCRAADLDKARAADHAPEYYSLINDFYNGGKAFEKNKLRYLNRRQHDDSPKYLIARCDAARYNNHFAPLIDFLNAACLQSKPQIVAEEIVAGAPGLAYWQRLNTDTDGIGTDLAAQASMATALFLKHSRAYVLVNFPESPIECDTLGKQLECGALDARLTVLGAEDVPYYEHREDGTLRMILVKRRMPAPSPFGEARHEEHIWNHIHENGMLEYRAIRQIDQREWGDENATLTRVRTWDSGMPVFPVGGVASALRRVPWIADRLISTCQQIFNLESALAFSLYTSAYAQLVISDDNTNLKNIIASELSAVKLSSNGKMYYVVPENTAFAAIATEIERLKTNLYSSINSSALQLPNSASNGRQSGVAKFMDFGAITVLIEAFSGLTRDAFGAAIRHIQKVRRDSDAVGVELRGLDDFDISQGSVAFDLLEKLMAQKELPPTARKLATQKMILVAFGEEIPAEDMTKLSAEIAAMNFTEKPAEQKLPAELSNGETEA